MQISINNTYNVIIIYLNKNKDKMYNHFRFYTERFGNILMFIIIVVLYVKMWFSSQ